MFKIPLDARAIARPGVLLNGPLGRGLERGCAGRAFSFLSRREVRVRAKCSENQIFPEPMNAIKLSISRLTIAFMIACCCQAAQGQATLSKQQIQERQAQLKADLEKMMAQLEEAVERAKAEATRIRMTKGAISLAPAQASTINQIVNEISGNTVRMLDNGAVISWESSTNANLYYDVYFRTNFDDPLESWFMLEQGYPSHGTNTYWKDTGYWGLVSQPGQDPTRFYKIVGWTNSATQPTVTISVPAGSLSGIIPISVTISTAAAVMASRLYVDGARVDEMDGSGTFSLDTSSFSSGEHNIFVIAETETGYETTDGGSVNTFNTTAYGLSQRINRVFTNSNVGAQGGPVPLPLTNTFGIMYQGNHPSWLDLGQNVNWAGPWNGLNSYVSLANEFTTPRPYGNIKSAFRIADGFMVGLGRVGHVPKFVYGNADMVRRGDMLRSPAWGGASKFNDVNFGFLIGHGVRGLSFDYTTGLPPVKDTYFPLWDEGTSYYDWVALSQCDFGSANLRWMAILSCNNLTEPNLTDLLQKKFYNQLIINENLHLLLGTGSAVYMVSNFGRIFADACVKGTNGTPMTIREAWFYAGRQTQAINNPNPGIPVLFTVVGYSSCWDDTIYNFTEPDYWLDDIWVETQQVYP